MLGCDSYNWKGYARQSGEASTRFRFANDVSEETKDATLVDRDLFCQMCGVTRGGNDDFTMMPAEFYVALKAETDRGIVGIESPIYMLCGDCHRGLSLDEIRETLTHRRCRNLQTAKFRSGNHRDEL